MNNYSETLNSQQINQAINLIDIVAERLEIMHEVQKIAQLNYIKSELKEIAK